MKLSELEIGQSAEIISVGGEGSLRQHILNMGLIPGVKVHLVKFAPMGDPIELRVFGYELTLRKDDAKKIEVEPIADNVLSISDSSREPRARVAHPGFGENNKYSIRTNGRRVSSEANTLTFALAGNQNCGKTTLFNQLTGSNQHVGNFPGVTVDRKTGIIKGYPNTEITDLPGIYSMSPYTSEEVVTRQYIIDEKPSCIINIVDATNIERNLYLTMQLMELDVPMVLALNMMDEMRGNGGSVRINEMESYLGIPVVPISAAKNEGVSELADHAIKLASIQGRPGRMDFCDENDCNGAVHRCLHGIMHLIKDHARRYGLPVRFAATKLVEGDKMVMDALHLTDNEKEMLEFIICQMEEERGLDRSAAIADMRFTFINKLVGATVIKPQESKEHERSKKIDKLLTGRHTAIPSFIVIISLVFLLTFNVIGAFFQGLIEQGVEYVTNGVDALLTGIGVNEVIHSLVIDGVFTGVGSVLSFLPIIVTLFFFLSLLEDTGYMARIAFVMDKLLRKIGVSGRSIVPMLIGFGCTVPGVMASRTLPSERDRRMTIMLTPFMSCSAKLPIYSFFVSTFFPKHGALVMIGLYFTGIAVGIIVALISKNTAFKGEPVPFVMELPNYRIPGAKNVLQLLWDKAKDFLQRAFTIIFLASIVIWFLQSFNLRLELVDNSRDSILALLAGYITPVFKPLGFADWRISTALISGFIAKESVVSSLLVLFGSAGSLNTALSTLTALPLLIFCLLYTPCVAAIASVKRELGARYATLMVAGQCVIAWLCAFIVRLVTMVL